MFILALVGMTVAHRTMVARDQSSAFVCDDVDPLTSFDMGLNRLWSSASNTSRSTSNVTTAVPHICVAWPMPDVGDVYCVARFGELRAWWGLPTMIVILALLWCAVGLSSCSKRDTRAPSAVEQCLVDIQRKKQPSHQHIRMLAIEHIQDVLHSTIMWQRMMRATVRSVSPKQWARWCNSSMLQHLNTIVLAHATSDSGVDTKTLQNAQRVWAQHVYTVVSSYAERTWSIYLDDAKINVLKQSIAHASIMWLRDFTLSASLTATNMERADDIWNVQQHVWTGEHEMSWVEYITSERRKARLAKDTDRPIQRRSKQRTHAESQLAYLVEADTTT